MKQITIDDAIADRDAAIETVSNNAGQLFREAAQTFIVNYLRDHGPTPGETLTDACLQAGIVPHDDRAFGSVYLALSRRGIIRKVGLCPRRKGHATSGGNVSDLTERDGGLKT